MTKTFDARLLWSLPRVGAPAIAGSNRLVVPVTTYDIDENQGTSRLWLVDGEGGSEPLTPEDLNASKPTVSPDFRRLAFVAAKRGESDRQLYVVDLSGGEPEAVTDLPLGCLGGRWLPAGSGLIVLAYVLRDHLSTDATAAVARPQPIARSGARRGKMTWLTAPDTSTRNPAAPTTA